MQSEVDPRIAYTVLGVIAVLVIGFLIWRTRTPAFNPQTTGSEAYQSYYAKTGRQYEPPRNAPVPRY